MSDDVDEQSGREESEHTEVNRHLFKDSHGFRVAFCFHRSIKKSFSRRNLTLDIERHGGIVLDTDVGCDTVLVDVKYDKKDALQNAYNTDNDPRLRNVYVEFAPFVQHCIRNNRFIHRLPALKGMGGYVGRDRVPFTAHDDDFLCHYIARILPDKAAGGRLGLGIYEALVRTAAVKRTHAWGARHTAESWKERYKKHAAKFDEWIEDIVKQEGRSRKQLWHEDRRATHKALRGRHNFEPEENSSEGNYEVEERPQRRRKRRTSDCSPPPPKRRRPDYSPDSPNRRSEHSSSSPNRYYSHSPSPPIRQRRSSLPSNQQRSDCSHSSPPPNRRRFDYSPPPPKRRRVVQHSSDQQVKMRSSKKGKARALEEEEEEEEEEDPDELPQFEDHADQDDPGPFRSRRSLETTKVAVDVLTHCTQPNTASFFTQETIVATAPEGNSGQSKEASPLPAEAAESSSLVRRSIQVDKETKQASSSQNKPLAVIDLTSPSGSIGRNSPVIQLSPTRTLVNPSQAQKTRPLPRAARRPQVIKAVAVDAPYRNTRSRSQSVEPFAPNSPVRKSKKGGKKKPKPVLATVDESQDDDTQDIENLEVAEEPMPPPIGDILDDEFHVEKMLTSNVRGVSLDTDDAQTEQNLRPIQPPRQAFSSFRRHPSDILKEFQESSVIWVRRSVPLTTRPHLSNRPVRNTQATPGSIPSPSLSRDQAEPPRTPLPRPRKNSVSSMDSFPFPGTRASGWKKKLRHQEKRSPYNPPRGTRAAKFAGSRR